MLGVSPDDEASHAKFKEKYELPFALLADTEHAAPTTTASGSRRTTPGRSTWASSARRRDRRGRATSRRSCAGSSPTTHADDVLAASEAARRAEQNCSLHCPLPRGCGGIGRRARFRSVCPSGRGGSSPLIRIRSRDDVSPHNPIGGLVARPSASRARDGVARRSRPRWPTDARSSSDARSAPLATTHWRARPQLQARIAASRRNARVARGSQRDLSRRRQVRWRYRLVVNGFAVVLPRAQLGAARGAAGRRRRDLPERAATGRSSTAARSRSARPRSGGPALATAGNGMKIGIIDDGDRPDATRSSTRPATDARRASRRARPRYTTAKVIVARAFPPAAPGLEERARSRSTREHRSTPRTSPASPPATPTRVAAGRAHLRRRAARVPRQLQGADDPDRRRRRPRRQLAGDRRGDRGGRRGRHGRDQPLARRAGDRAVPRHRRARARRRGARRRRPGRRRRQRLRRVRPRLGQLARLGAEAITVGAVTTTRARHGRRRRVLLLERPDAALAAAEAGGERAGRRRSSRPSPGGGYARSPGRAWRRRTSPGRPRCCCSGTRPGRRRRSSRRSRRRATTCSPTTRKPPSSRPSAAAAAIVNLPRADKPLALRRPRRALVRARRPRRHGDAAGRAHRRRRRRGPGR